MPPWNDPAIEDVKGTGVALVPRLHPVVLDPERWWASYAHRFDEISVVFETVVHHSAQTYHDHSDQQHHPPGEVILCRSE